MTDEVPPGRTAAATGEYHGLPTRRLQNDRLWIDVLAAAGPRIIRLGVTGSDRNLLAETPDMGWETPTGRYELFGGHRLWFAPEDPDRVAVPDTDGLLLEAEGSGLRLTGTAEPQTGLVRSMVIRLDATAAALTLRHKLCNTGPATLELAPWAITQLPLGGIVLLPQPTAIDGHHVRPNRSLVLWPYTSWADSRLELRDGLIVVRAEPGRRFKVGTFDEAGWVGYLRDGTLLIRRFEPAVGLRHPDLGCNVETFCRDRFLELEVLGPLAELAPGAAAVQVERWVVARTSDGLLDLDLDLDPQDATAIRAAVALAATPVAAPPALPAGVPLSAFADPAA